ncbi:adenosine receptor A2a-like [Montipora capricornis]|uniref:adenosine receptor A2a-like n=1 Tax=Montipora capricornis TaxID=246305 RepID=UPI0035F137D7
MAWPLWFSALSWIFTILGIVGNSFVIFLISSKKRLSQIYTNHFLLSLSFADLAISFSLQPANYFCFLSKELCQHDCLGFFQWAFLYASVFNLCVVTLDRYVAIVKPLIYGLFMTKTRVMILICMAWIIPFVSSLIPLTFLHNLIAMKYYSYYMVIAFEILPMLFLVSTTVHMIIIAKKVARETASVINQLKHNHPGTDGDKTAPTRRKHTGLFFVISIVVFFVFCYLFALVITFCHIFHLCSTPPSLHPVKKILLIANSAFNPFAYAFLKNDVKEEVKRFLRLRVGARKGHR